MEKWLKTLGVAEGVVGIVKEIMRSASELV